MRQPDVFAALLDDVIARGFIAQFRAEGTSMLPTIRDGESIAVASLAPRDIVRGDVVLYRRDARLLAHRVVGVRTAAAGRVFDMRGDAKAANDAPVGEDAIVGAVLSVQRNGRAVSLSGRRARLRHHAGAFASRVKAFVVYHPCTVR